MATHEPSHPDNQQETGEPAAPKTQQAARRRRTPDVTEARSQAQRAKLDAQAQTRQQQATGKKPIRQAKGKTTQEALQARRRAGTTIARAIDDYLQDHDGGNHSAKTLEWHSTALGLLRNYLQEERGITLVGEVDAPDISAWFAAMRASPGVRGKVRSERTIQTYARSARAFFHRLVRRETSASFRSSQWGSTWPPFLFQKRLARGRPLRIIEFDRAGAKALLTQFSFLHHASSLFSQNPQTIRM